MKLSAGTKIRVNYPDDKYHGRICIVDYDQRDNVYKHLMFVTCVDDGASLLLRIDEMIPIKRKGYKLNLP